MPYFNRMTIKKLSAKSQGTQLKLASGEEHITLWYNESLRAAWSMLSLNKLVTYLKLKCNRSTGSFVY